MGLWWSLVGPAPADLIFRSNPQIILSLLGDLLSNTSGWVASVCSLQVSVLVCSSIIAAEVVAKCNVSIMYLYLPLAIAAASSIGYLHSASLRECPLLISEGCMCVCVCGAGWWAHCWCGAAD